MLSVRELSDRLGNIAEAIHPVIDDRMQLVLLQSPKHILKHIPIADRHTLQADVLGYDVRQVELAGCTAQHADEANGAAAPHGTHRLSERARTADFHYVVHTHAISQVPAALCISRHQRTEAR